MTETTGASATLETPDTTVNRVPARHDHRPNRLYRALAWVGIAAGSLFIVATVFFSGYVLGQHGGGGPHHGPRPVMLHKPFPGPGGPMGREDGPMGPGDGPMGPGDGPRAERVTPPSPPTPSSSTPARP